MLATTRKSEYLFVLFFIFFLSSAAFNNSTWRFSNVRKKKQIKSWRYEIANDRGSERWKYIKHKFQNVSCGRALCVCMSLKDSYVYEFIHVQVHNSCICNTRHALLCSPLYTFRTCAHRKFFTFHDSADRYHYMRYEKSKIFFTLESKLSKFRSIRII